MQMLKGLSFFTAHGWCRRAVAGQRGFSLVELSIVLVILGLLTGGILAGQSLIRAAELRTIGRDLEKYRTAHNLFRDKYFGMPGDLRNAYSFWQGDANCSSNTTVSAANNLGCNGDGDGTINVNIGESYKYWLHLRLAGLIEGRYDGWYPANFGGTGWYNHIAFGRNVPSWLNKQDAGFQIFSFPISWRGWTGGDTATNSRNRLQVGNWSNDVLPAQEAWNIDTKFDDGKPGLGALTANIVNVCTASGSTVASTAEYNLGNAAPRCSGLDWAIE
ncbi:MAG: hypothetical protein DI582_07145 [Azospirillum brasilense]|nr:MAG: hypothetical protein DI582_07145 [Azospirillum brasilense]